MKQVHKFCRQNTELFNVKAGGVYIQKLALRFRKIYDLNSSQASVNTNICFHVI